MHTPTVTADQIRAEIEQRERHLIGNNQRQVGHLIIQRDQIRKWVFARCRCGFLLTKDSVERVWWIRAVSPPVEITNLRQLCYALSTHCRFHPRRQVTTPTPVAEPSKPVRVAPADPVPLVVIRRRALRRA
jgi:hypothetical protein